MDENWVIEEEAFEPAKQHHRETIFTIGNGYLSTRGALEEGYLGDSRATFIHGVFDAAPIVETELANAPDWLPLTVWLNGQRFDLLHGHVERYHRALNLRTGVLTRTVRWVAPSGDRATLTFERFASLADPHVLFLRCRVLPEFPGTVEFRAAINARVDNEGLVHWQWLDQGARGKAAWLHARTRHSEIESLYAMCLTARSGEEVSRAFWDVQDAPTLVLSVNAAPGEEIVVEKQVVLYTSRDLPAAELNEKALYHIHTLPGWEETLEQNRRAWAKEWDRSDVVIEGDPPAQLAIRFNLFQLLIAAPRHDNRVNIGAKTLSGFGYRGHSFWDTELFMLPLFTFTGPAIARNLLDYRYQRLPSARRKAAANGFEGAQFPWESADTGDEVTPAWVPNFADPTKLVRIWTGEIEIHISADIAYAAHQYWLLTGDDAWFAERGAELILDTAKFYASRAEWQEAHGEYGYRDVIGPDEYHEHVDNNFYTNRIAQWNLQTALQCLEWLRPHAPDHANELIESLDLSPARLDHWREVIDKMRLPVEPSGLIPQFDGFFQRTDVDLKTLEPRDKSVQVIFGIEGTNRTQVLKQPDVLMLFYLLPDGVSADRFKVNYDYYTPRTDYTFGSSLGPSMGAILACRLGQMDEAYEQFMRSAVADLYDVRGNARDGIHGASAGGTWQAVVFGFGGLRVTPDGWTTEPRLPEGWKRLAFKFYYRGKQMTVELKGQTKEQEKHPVAQPGRDGDEQLNAPKASEASATHSRAPASPLRGFIFDLDGVLTDTAEYHYRAWQRLADEEGIPFSREENEALRGVSRRESLLLLLKGRKVPEDQLQEMMERKNRYYREFLLSMTPKDLLPGAKELLEELRAAGIKVAIGSASKNAQEVIDRLGLAPLMDAVADGYSVSRPKPAPDLFLFAAQELGLPPSECVVVEDAAAGIEAAKAGGFRTIGLGPASRVGEADIVLPSLEGVKLDQLLHAAAQGR